MALNLNLLRSFWYVAKSGSVSGAAREAYVSQPALSKAVRELEAQTGLPLLERGAKGIILTEAGRVLFEYAQAIFSLERDAEAALRAQKSLEGITLRIGASTTISTYVLPPILERFRQRNPGVRLSLIRDNTQNVEARLLEYSLDVALVEGPPHSPQIEKTFWRDEELVLVCSPQHPLATKRAVLPADLQAQNWLVREPGSGTREVVENALEPYGLPPVDAMEIGGAEALKQAVAAGLGVAYVSREAAGDQLALGRLRTVPVQGIDLRRPFYILHLKGRPLSAAARVFEGFMIGG